MAHKIYKKLGIGRNPIVNTLDPGSRAIANREEGAPLTAGSVLHPSGWSPEVPPAPEAPGVPTLDEAKQRVRENDRLRRRRGVLANIFGGASKSQPTVAVKTLLGS